MCYDGVVQVIMSFKSLNTVLVVCALFPAQKATHTKQHKGKWEKKKHKACGSLKFTKGFVNT